MKAKEVAVLLVLAALWGGGFLFIRIATPVLGPLALMAMRVVMTGLCLFLFALAAHTRLELRTHWKHFLVVGIINAVVPFTLIGVAELYLTSGLAALLNATTPLFGALTAVLWMKEPMTLKKAVGIGLGLLGVVVVVGWSTFPITTALILSVGASLAAAASYGIASVYIKVYLGKVNSLATSTSSQFFAAIFLIPLAFAAPPTRIPTLTVLLAVAALAVFCTAATLLLFVWLIAHAGPTKALTVTFLAPVFGVFWGVLFLKEPLTISPFIGLIIILFGAGLVTELLWPAKRKRVAAVSAALDEHSLVAQTSESEFAS